MDVQKWLFDWIANQPFGVGLTVFGIGLLYGFFGYRFARFVLVFPTAGCGCILGALGAEYAGVPALYLMAAGGLLGAVLAIARPPAAAVIAGGATLAALGGYITWQFGFRANMPTTAMLLGGAAGLTLTWLTRHPMIIVITTLQGAGLIMVGFVGVAAKVMPTMCTTFRHMAQDYGVMVPVLLSMLTVTAYSIQANSRRGSMFTGMERAPKV